MTLAREFLRDGTIDRSAPQKRKPLAVLRPLGFGRRESAFQTGYCSRRATAGNWRHGGAGSVARADRGARGGGRHPRLPWRARYAAPRERSQPQTRPAWGRGRSCRIRSRASVKRVACHRGCGRRTPARNNSVSQGTRGKETGRPPRCRAGTTGTRCGRGRVPLGTRAPYVRAGTRLSLIIERGSSSRRTGRRSAL